MERQELESDMAQEPEEENWFEKEDEEFLALLNELQEEKDLETFFVEYNNMTKTLKKCRDNEKRLKSICQELKSEHLSILVKVTPEKLEDEDEQQVITNLQQEIEEALKIKVELDEKQQRTEKMMTDMQDEISRLIVQEPTAQQRISNLQIKVELTAKRDELLSMAVSLRKNILMANEEEINAACYKAQETQLQLELEICLYQDKCASIKQCKDKLESEVKQLQTNMQTKQTEALNLTEKNQLAKEQLEKLEKELNQQKDTLNNSIIKDMKTLELYNTEVQREVAETKIAQDKLYTDNIKQAMELGLRQEEMSGLKEEVAELEKITENTQMKILLVEEEKLEVDHQQDLLKNEITELEREKELESKRNAYKQKIMDELLKQRKKLLEQAKSPEVEFNWRNLHKSTMKILDQEILSYKDEVKKQRKVILLMEKERDKYAKESIELTQKTLHYLEKIKSQEVRNLEYKFIIAETDELLETYYKDISNDCSNHRKLIVAQREFIDVKCKMDVVSHQIKQFRDAITRTKTALHKVFQEIKMTVMEKQAYKEKLEEMKQACLDDEQFVASQKVEQGKLLKTIADLKTDVTQKNIELDQVNRECKLLGKQLVSQDNDMAELCDKIKTQQMVLNKAEIEHNRILEYVQFFNLEISGLQMEKSALSKAVSEVEDLRREVNHMKRKLQRKQLIYRDEVREITQNRVNVHRWRKLQVSDPITFELIQKLHSFQQQLLSKSKEMMERNLLLWEKQLEYKELKQIIARYPSPDAEEQLQMNKQEKWEKRKRLKALELKLAQCMTQIQDQKQEIKQKEHEMQSLKMMYFTRKRKELKSVCRNTL